MPNATITSTASTFGTISGTFAADQSTITGTISGVITGTLDGSVGVPGPQGSPGVGVPAGGLTAQFLQKTSGLDYATDWVTLPAYLPLAGGTMDVNATIELSDTFTGTVSEVGGYGMAVSSDSNNNLLSNFLYDRIFVKNATSQTTLKPTGVEFPDATLQTTAFTGWNNVALTGNPTAPTAGLADNDTSIATTAFVQQELASGTANARNLEVYVRNQTGSTLAAGTIVYINGATGNRPTVTPAQANNDANSAQTFGFVKTSIANNGFGFVIVRGEVENLDTSALTEGVQLYLSPTTAGAYTTTKPSAPQHLVYVGIVVRAHPTQGVILAAIQNGYELNEIHDVAISSITDGDLLSYESATTLWKNKSISTLGLATQSWVTSQGYLTSAPVTSVAGRTGAITLSNTDISGLGTMATATASDYSTTTVANGLYYPLTGNPSSFITSSALTGYALESWVTTQLGSYLTTATAASTYQTLSGMSSYLTTSAAASTYYPLTGNPSSFLVAADIAGKANLASPALTGNVTITSNSASPALVITQDGAGDIVQFKDVTSDTTYAFIDASGKVSTIASTTANAGFNIAHGVAPSVPVDGDIWTTTGGVFARINSSTRQLGDTVSALTYSGNNIFSGTTLSFGSSTATSTVSLGAGATISGATKAINIGTNGVSGSTTNIAVGSTTGTNAITINGPTTLAGTLTASGATITVGNTTAASTLNLATGATLTATTKAVNIGTSGVAGSTTNITIGSTTGTSTTTLQGNTNSVTQTAGNSTTLLATTAFVTTADNLKANLASPTFTGTPSLPTGTIAVTQTAGNNTTAVATTAFVTAAVPGFATTAEIASPSSTTKVVAPNDVVRMIVNRATFDTQNSSPTFATSGTGAEGYKATNDRVTIFRTPNAGIAGYGQMIYETIASSIGVHGAQRGGDIVSQDYSKKIWMSGTVMFSSLGDANTVSYCMMGGRNTVTTGDPSMQGFGWKLVGGGTALKLITYGWTGSALTVTETVSSFTPVANQTFDWMILNEGTGAGGATSTCKLYVNDSLVASGVNAPGGANVNFNYFFQSAESTSSVATPMRFLALPVKFWWSKS